MDKRNNDLDSNQEIPFSKDIFNVNNNNLPTTVTEIFESRDQNTLPISDIMPNIKEFDVSFSNNDNNDKEKETIGNSKRLKLGKNDLFKIYKMSQITKDDFNSYILFSFTTIKSEIVTNTEKAYKLDYNKLKKLIENYYIQIPNKENN